MVHLMYFQHQNALDKTHGDFIIKTSVSNYCEYMFYQ